MAHTDSNQSEILQSLFISACEYQQQGNLQKAKDIYLQILEKADNPLLRYNLGLIYYDEDNIEFAKNCFEAGDRLKDDDIDTIFNLALCQKQLGQAESAAATYQRLLCIDPHHVDALYNLAGCFRELKDYQQAIKYYRDVLSLHPEHEPSTNNIAYSYQVTGIREEALRHYRLLLDLNPDHDGAKHMVASLEGRSADKSPETYVRDVFDNYSDHYEDSLVNKLEYSVPAKMRILLDTLPGLPDRFKNGIDLGCGTGLSGESFADKVTILSGVDLSPKMIKAAEKKGIYANLMVTNLLDALHRPSGRYDFFLAADVFAYVGKLEDLFDAINTSSDSGAVICFSTEAAEGKDYTLRSTGRFAHSPEYIRALAAQKGWDEQCHQQSDLRKEAGKWVAGDLWVFQNNA